MTFFQIYLQANLVIMIMMTILWGFSVILKNISIVNIFKKPVHSFPGFQRNKILSKRSDFPWF